MGGFFICRERVNAVSAVTCNNCKRKFEIKRIQTEDMGNGIERTFFSCSFCLQEYTGFYTDESIRTQQEKIRRAIRNIDNHNYDQKVLKKRIAKMQRKTKDEMDALKEKIEQPAASAASTVVTEVDEANPSTSPDDQK